MFATIDKSLFAKEDQENLLVALDVEIKEIEESPVDLRKRKGFDYFWWSQLCQWFLIKTCSLFYCLEIKLYVFVDIPFYFWRINWIAIVWSLITSKLNSNFFWNKWFAMWDTPWFCLPFIFMLQKLTICFNVGIWTKKNGNNSLFGGAFANGYS